MKTADSDQAVAELVRLVGQTRRRLWIAAARALAARGESVVAWSLVNRLAELGPLTQRELADASAQHPAGVSRQLDELERKGLTTRGADPSDRRRRVVDLTAAGQRWHRQLRPLVDSLHEQDFLDRETLQNLRHRPTWFLYSLLCYDLWDKLFIRRCLARPLHAAAVGTDLTLASL